MYSDSALSDGVKSFLSEFKKDGKYIYLDKIDMMPAQNLSHITIQYTDFAEHTKLENEFAKSPDRMLDCISRAIWEILQIRFPDYAKMVEGRVEARISGFPLVKSVRDVNSEHSGKFISVKGIVIRMSPPESIPLVAAFICPEKHISMTFAKKNFTIDIPAICEKQNCKYRDLELVGDLSIFVDYQIIQLQELPGELPAGKLPKVLGVFVAGKLVDSARMGDTVEISGLVRAELSHEIKLGSKVQTYRQRLYANNIERVTAENDFDGIITDDDIKTIGIIRTMNENKATEFLISSFAPHVYGHNLIKEAIILTMVGGDSTVLLDGTRIRGDINIFLVGDPGTAKSEMGKAAYRTAPRAFYASGRGSSGAGLTAATIQDKTTGAYMLEPGVTVLADKGLAVIDEFDKMRPEDRSALHEVMEQQSASISKGGITATLNARASIIAVANSIYGKYDPYRNLTENIPGIPIPLLTRFDLIFVIRDVADHNMDDNIARHIVSTRKNGNSPYVGFDASLFAKYIRMARVIKPKLSILAEEKLIEYYLKMRTGSDENYIITPRHLEGLIRLATARAKCMLKDTITPSDAKRAIHIMEKMLESSGVDGSTGKVDLGILEGKPSSEVAKLQLFQDIMKNMSKSHEFGDGATKDEIISEMIKSGRWDDISSEEMFGKILRGNLIYEISTGRYRLVS